MFNVLITNEDLCGLLLSYFSPESADILICHRLYSQLAETSVDKQLWRSILLKVFLNLSLKILFEVCKKDVLVRNFFHFNQVCQCGSYGIL